jgi:Na+/melibiose symporter-like transporter
VPQSDLVLDTMKFMFTLLPCIFYIVAAFLFSFFKLNEETYNNIRNELDTNRKATQL